MIPVLEPVVMAFSPAEFFLMAMLGITFIAFLAGGDQIFKGIIVGLLGLILATIGTDPYTGTPRFAGDFLFLWDGLSLVTAVLAIFAIPEMIALAVAAARFPRSRWKARNSPTGNYSKASWKCRSIGGWCSAPPSSARLSA